MRSPKNADHEEREEQLTEALKAYKSGVFKSYRAAARAFRVSKTTLIEHDKGRKPCHQAHEEDLHRPDRIKTQRLAAI
jgi:helix-turn-helix, Psq domain